MRNAFTLIEILVVIAIIGVMAGVGINSYQAAIASSRDARRKADLENLRSALELYRSNNNLYPATLDVSCGSSASIADASNTYLNPVPKDPGCTNRAYIYTSTGDDYTLGAALESAGSSTCGTCGSVSCNYCLGPFGTK
jgi:general secretion pathway protein G